MHHIHLIILSAPELCIAGYGGSLLANLIKDDGSRTSCPPERAARTTSKVILPVRSERASPAVGQDVRDPSGKDCLRHLLEFKILATVTQSSAATNFLPDNAPQRLCSAACKRVVILMIDFRG